MILSQDNSSSQPVARCGSRVVRYEWRGRRDRSEKPQSTARAMNFIERLVWQNVVLDVKRLLEAERGRRGYYPPLPELFRLIEGEFGETMTGQLKRQPGRLLTSLRKSGVAYSKSGAAQFASRQDAGKPLMDIDAAFLSPWGTVRNYLYWRMPRLAMGDRFELDGVTFERPKLCSYVLTCDGVRRGVEGKTVNQAFALVLMALRGDNVAEVLPAKQPEPFQPVPAAALPYRNGDERLTLARRYHAQGYSVEAIMRMLNTAPVDKSGLPAVTVNAPKWRAPDLPAAPAPAPEVEEPATVIPAGVASDLPPLLYNTQAEIHKLAAFYLKRGYTLAQIQAALVRADLAAEGGQDVQ